MEGVVPAPALPPRRGGGGGEDSYPSALGGKAEEGTTISTVMMKLCSTIILPAVSVPTAGGEGYPLLPVNNPCAVGPSYGFGNGAVTKTLSLATVKPTGAGVPAPA